MRGEDQESWRAVAHPSACGVELEILFGFFFAHVSAQNLDAFGAIIDSDCWPAWALLQHPDQGVLEAVSQERLWIELGYPVA
jgi:hypothetical protein